MEKKSYLQLIVTVAVALLVAFVLFIIGLESITPIWDSGLLNRISLAVILGVLLIWIIGWIVFDITEAGEVDNSLGKHVSPILKMSAMAIGILIAMAFGGLISLIGKIEFFIPVFGFIVLTASIGDHLTIKRIIKKVKDKDPSADKKIVGYYTDNAHMLLHCVQLFLMAISAGAYIFLIRGNPIGNEWIAYLIISLSIIINEYYLWKWRIKRFKEDS